MAIAKQQQKDTVRNKFDLIDLVESSPIPTPLHVWTIDKSKKNISWKGKKEIIDNDSAIKAHTIFKPSNTVVATPFAATSISVGAVHLLLE